MKAAICLLFAALAAHAEGVERDVRAELFIAEVPMEDGLRLAPKMESDPETAVREIHTMIAHDQAHLIASSVLRTPSGQRGVSQTSEEVRYAVEYTPPLGTGFATHSIYEVFPMEKARRLSQQKIDVPTAFETRDAGTSFELKPVVAASGLSIRADIAVSHVFFDGMRRVLSTPSRANDRVYERPKFRTLKTTVTATYTSARWALLLRSTTPSGQFALFFIRLTAIPTPP
jgi:hypothetical protein